MKSIKFVRKIKNFAIASFLIPLIAINACLLLYKLLGNIEVHPNKNWNELNNEQVYSYDEFQLINKNVNSSKVLTNCPKHVPEIQYITSDNKIIIDKGGKTGKIIEKLKKNNKIDSVVIKYSKILNDKCVKNYNITYGLLISFTALEKILIETKQNNPSGFSKIKNPYQFGEVSISRTARYFPAILIFRTLIILSALLLFFYWKNNLNFFNDLRNNNTLSQFSKSFFYLGMLSCIFLALHATFLGVDIDSELFTKVRRLIIILFILFEILAQILLTKNLFQFKNKLNNYINPSILKIKIIFVSLVLITTCVAFFILVYYDPSSSFKHALEWNYFAFLLLYYFLSRLLWK